MDLQVQTWPFQDKCDLTTLKENVGDAINKLIDLDIVFARYTPFLTEDRFAYEGKAKYNERNHWGGE